MARIPLDKNWIKCFTVLEIKCAGHIVKEFLKDFPEDEMSDDVKACRDAMNTFNEGVKYIPVGNFRSLAVALDMLFKQNNFGDRELLMGSELRGRVLHDKNSSQQMSGIILTAWDTVIEDRMLARGDIDKFKPQIRNAILAKKMYEEAKYGDQSSRWLYNEDETIKKQFNYFVAKLCGKDVKVDIRSAEDVPLAYMMDEITLEEAEKRFPSLRNHETNRIEEMERQKRRLYRKPSIFSTDHRIVMACAMAKHLIDYDWEGPKIGYDYAVNKSFPKFWEYLEEITQIYK